MARKIKPGRNFTGLYYAREARHMSRSELGRLTGTSKQQLSRLEAGHIKLRLDHLKPYAKHLGFSPEQILLWGKYPGTPEGGGHIDMRAVHADTVDAAVDGGGHIQVYAANALHAAVSGGGRIQYWGNPQVSSAISGGGDVRQGS